MKNICHLLLFATILFCACKEKDKTVQKNTATTVEQLSTFDNNTSTEPFPANSYKRFEGTIVGKHVVVNMQSDSTKDATVRIQGSYFYPDGEFIYINSVDSSKTSKHLILEEWSSTKDKQDRWICNYKNGTIQGIWESGDRSKTYNINLKESYPKGSYHFETQQYAGGTDNWLAISIIKAIDDPESEWINQAIIRNLNISAYSTFEKGVEQYFKREAGTFEASFRNNFSRKGYDSISVRMQESEATISDISYKLNYNQNGYVILEILNEEMSGGVHPNHSSTELHLDIQNKKQIQLSDILTLDTTSLGNMLTKIGNKQYSWNKASIPMSNSFYFNNQGITFTYDPYEIASYAEGTIEITIPYSEIKKYLTPEFKRRMQL